MINKINIDLSKKTFIIYIFLAIITLAVYGQGHQFEFINFDDPVYVTENGHVQSGLTLDGIRWAFSTFHAEFWHPLTWLSLMLDYEIYGLNAGGFHMTNLILHILSTLLLFWLFHRMTGAVWESAFVAALFAIHPLHVESVVWVSERKDVLSAFFWMLTLCFYVRYSEKPDLKKYLLILIFFLCALMSKAMAVTLPVIMILLDYWPLKRFTSQKDNVILWQLKEKAPFFTLSIIFSIITIFAQSIMFMTNSPMSERFANAPVSFMMYLIKTFWPYDMAVFYPFSDQLPLWQIFGSTLLIIVISIAVIRMWKSLPYLFVGWLWYAIILLPVMGIIRPTIHSMHDNYTYLPSIGVAIVMAWGIPLLFQNERMRKKIIFPVATTVLAVFVLITWHQCAYWKNSITLFSHALRVTKKNCLMHSNLANSLIETGNLQEALYHYNEAIRIFPYYADALNNRGNVYVQMGQYQKALEDFNKSIHYYTDAINNKNKMSFSIGPSNHAISRHVNSLLAGVYNNRGIAYFNLGDYLDAIKDFNISIRLKDDNFKAYYNRGRSFSKINKFQNAIDDYDKSISLQPKNSEAYISRGVIHFKMSNDEQGCYDAQKACELGNCKLLKKAKDSQTCH